MHCSFVIFLFTQLSLLSTPTFSKIYLLSETRLLALKVVATMKTRERGRLREKNFNRMLRAHLTEMLSATITMHFCDAG